MDYVTDLIMKAFATIGLVAVLSISSAWAGGEGDGGGWTSGGGDPLRFYFTEGRGVAADMVQRFAQAAQGTRADVAAWILANREALCADILASPHEWVTESQVTCGLTTFSRDIEIKLSATSCRSVSTNEEAAKLLIHESIHHFGIKDEEFADAAAIAVAASWEEAKLRSVPRCTQAPDSLAESLPGSWRVDLPLTKKLGGGHAHGMKGLVTFTRDDANLSKFQGFGHCAWLTGIMRLENGHGVQSWPYVVIDWRGRAQLVTLEASHESDGHDHLPGLRKGLHHWSVDLTRAQDRQNDLLFLGNSHADFSRTAFGRTQ